MDNYEDIIHLPHYRSAKRSHMSMEDRAAQFSPFAALTGFDSAIEETGRITDSRPELMEYGNIRLNQALTQLMQLLPEQPPVSLVCFVPDTRKSGGHTETYHGLLYKINMYDQTLMLTDGRTVPLADLLHIESSRIEHLNDM